MRLCSQASNMTSISCMFFKLSISFSWCHDINRLIACFHMTSQRPYWCPKTMKRRPCWCPKPVLWELNSFLMQTLSFVPINLRRCLPREWKHSIVHFNCYLSTNNVSHALTWRGTRQAFFISRHHTDVNFLVKHYSSCICSCLYSCNKVQDLWKGNW